MTKRAPITEPAYRELSRFLKETTGPGGPVLFRGDEELSFLKRFVAGTTRPAPSAAAPRHAATARAAIRECTRCRNVYDKKAPYGTGENGIMVILHAPAMLGASEKKQYRQESAALLKKMLAAIGVDIEACYVTSLIKCETDDSLNKPSGMFNNCEKILIHEMAEARPRIVIVMGDIIPLRRIINRYKEAHWFSVDHPIALLKNPGLKKKAWTTLKLVMEKIGTPPAP